MSYWNTQKQNNLSTEEAIALATGMSDNEDIAFETILTDGTVLRVETTNKNVKAAFEEIVELHSSIIDLTVILWDVTDHGTML